MIYDIDNRLPAEGRYYGTGGVAHGDTHFLDDDGPFNGWIDTTGACEFFRGVGRRARISNTGGGVCHGDFAGRWDSTGTIVITGRILPGAWIDTTGPIMTHAPHPDMIAGEKPDDA